jgi:HAD superfamily hydrolase (TIGR01450 family)
MPFKFPTRLNKELANGLIKQVDNFLFDCDGVIWHWPKPIDGSVDFINKLKHLGKKCFFVTNNSAKTRALLLDQFTSIGIKGISLDDIVCVSWVLGAYLKSIKFTDKVYVIGNESMGKELDNANIKVRASKI